MCSSAQHAAAAWTGSTQSPLQPPYHTGTMHGASCHASCCICCINLAPCLVHPMLHMRPTCTPHASPLTGICPAGDGGGGGGPPLLRAHRRLCQGRGEAAGSAHLRTCSSARGGPGCGHLRCSCACLWIARSCPRRGPCPVSPGRPAAVRPTCLLGSAPPVSIGACKIEHSKLINRCTDALSAA